jgi:hypothetical protein
MKNHGIGRGLIELGDLDCVVIVPNHILFLILYTHFFFTPTLFGPKFFPWMKKKYKTSFTKNLPRLTLTATATITDILYLFYYYSGNSSSIYHQHIPCPPATAPCTLSTIHYTKWPDTLPPLWLLN